MPKKINPMRAMVIGYKLNKLIEESEVSKSELAKYLGVNPSQITRILNGSGYPSFDLFVGIADFFGVSTDFLLGRGTVGTLDNEILCPDDEAKMTETDIKKGILEAVGNDWITFLDIQKQIPDAHTDQIAYYTGILASQNKLESKMFPLEGVGYTYMCRKPKQSE